MEIKTTREIFDTQPYTDNVKWVRVDDIKERTDKIKSLSKFEFLELLNDLDKLSQSKDKEDD